SLVSTMLNRVQEIGASTLARKSPFQLLPQTLFDSVFAFLTLSERLAVAERVCRRWRSASLDGAGWQSFRLPAASDRKLIAFCLNLLAKSGRLLNTRTIDARLYF